MARISLKQYYSDDHNHNHNRRVVGGSNSTNSILFIIVPTGLALLTSLFILFYIYSTSNLFIITTTTPYLPTPTTVSVILSQNNIINASDHHNSYYNNSSSNFQWRSDHDDHGPTPQSQRHLLPPPNIIFSPKGESENNNNDVFHDRDMFLADYKEMNRTLKIYIYPHTKDDPFANILLPVKSEPGGNYASEGFFKTALSNSHFITKDPSQADLFFLPFSIATLRNDRRVGVGGIPDFIRDYIHNVIHKYPYWNRTGGADHFYVACHSIGKSAMIKAPAVMYNAIQIVCSSNYFVTGYIAHKDACLPQIWPRKGDPPNLASSKRKKLAFFAGAANSPVRIELVKKWRNDTEIFAHPGRLKTPYSDELLGSKFCLHVKGYEVNTARIGDSLYYGCVPVILANHYDLPFEDVLNWKSFSVVVNTLDMALLKNILKGINSSEYLMLQSNVLKVRKHFQWHSPPLDFDAFYMVLYELWLRRNSIKNFVV